MRLSMRPNLPMKAVLAGKQFTGIKGIITMILLTSLFLKGIGMSQELPGMRKTILAK